MPSGTRLIQYVKEFNSLFTLWTIIKKWTLFYACDALLLAKSYHRKRCFVKYLFHVIMNMFVLTRGIINDESIKINILGRMFYYEVILQGVAKLAYSEFGA
jgi:hypothetical protein